MERLLSGSNEGETAEARMWGLLSPIPTLAVTAVEKYGHSGSWRPLADIKLTPKQFTVFLDLPGIDEDTIDVAVSDGRLHITGERDFEFDNEDPEEFTQIGRVYGRYEFDATLPKDAVSNQMTARYRRGVLKVNVPRMEVSK